MQIRRMTSADVDAVAAIENESFEFPWSKRSLKDELINPIATYLVVCDNDGAVCGYGGYLKVSDEAYITNIAVKSSERNKGYGSLIIKALIDEARISGVKAITLEVRVGNVIAIKIYQSFGFKSVGIRPKFYPDGEDAEIYWLTL